WFAGIYPEFLQAFSDEITPPKITLHQPENKSDKQDNVTQDYVGNEEPVASASETSEQSKSPETISPSDKEVPAEP
ncbi:19424_t:CDS:2, partial [Gigaspora rosea]